MAITNTTTPKLTEEAFLADRESFWGTWNHVVMAGIVSAVMILLGLLVVYAAGGALGLLAMFCAVVGTMVAVGWAVSH